MDLFKIAISAFGSMVSLFFFTKIMGNREMSQLSMFDYVSSIAIGSIAGEMAVMSTDSFLEPLVAMIVFSVSSIFISYITCKSIVLRRFFEGQALLLYQDGIIYDKNLLRARLDVDELLSSCRLSGYFDLEDIHSVYLESNGTVSILPKSQCRPLTPDDLNIDTIQARPMANVIIDGKILKDNLMSTGKDETWLEKQLLLKGIKEKKELLLVTYDYSLEKINIYRKMNKKMLRDIFE
ncbi:MAG: hypothetical protein K0S76_1185 [Herbinix sp.]|jgi:uncharacterized membrane protein YcaP (DUF421 family)|nr:hypothetical protein [Herbinix sp.]